MVSIKNRVGSAIKISTFGTLKFYFSLRMVIRISKLSQAVARHLAVRGNCAKYYITVSFHIKKQRYNCYLRLLSTRYLSSYVKGVALSFRLE